MLSAFVLSYLYKLERKSTSTTVTPVPEATTEDSLKSPIYAVDFTSTTFTPSTTTNIPKTLRLRAKRSPKIIKASKPTPQQLNEPILTKSQVDLKKSQIYIFYTTLTGSSLRLAKNLHEKLSLMELVHEPKLLSLDDDVDDLEKYFLKPQNLMRIQRIYTF